VHVAAGSLGLVVVGVLVGVVDSATSITVMALACTATVLVIRQLPETAGIDVIGTRSADDVALG
jgi:hypothetical protein